MSRFKMHSKTVMASTEDALYEHATDLQLATALQVVSPFPMPFNPHISEFPEFASILMWQKRRGRS